MTVLALKPLSEADVFQEDFAANAAHLPGAGQEWLDRKRAAALQAFARTGMPTRRVEAWKYTDLAAALESPLEPAARFPGAVREAGAFAGVAGTRLTLVSGFLHAVGDREEDIDIVDLAAIGTKVPDWVKDHLGLLAAGPDQPLGAASLALMRGGVALRVRASNAALHLNFVNPAGRHDVVIHSRILIVVEEGASLRLLESHSGEGNDQSLTNLGIEINLRPGAKLEHVRLQSESQTALHVTSIGASLERDAGYRALYAGLGAKLSRLDVIVQLRGPGAEANLHNVSAPSSGISDVTTVMDHASPHTTSRQLFKSVVGGHGRSVSQGRVVVREGAVKSDSHQLFKALLLSPRAEADAKPELEIFADDVICGHGTAIGALDADALFYLRARGIPEAEAKGLLIRAFLEDAIGDFVDPVTHDAIWRRLDAALTAMGQEVK